MPEDNVTDNALDDAIIEELGGENDGIDDGESQNDGGEVSASDDEDSDLDGETESDDADKIDWAKELQDSRSEVGRLKKEQKETNTQIKSISENMNSLINLVKSTQQQGQQETELSDPDDPIPLTMGGLMNEFKKFQSNQNQTQTQAQQEYQDSYLNVIGQLGSQYSDKVHQHIVERMYKDFNVKHSNQPELDAQLNFERAKSAILEESGIKKKNPLQGNKGKAPLGGSTNTDQDVKSAQVVPLDSYAQDFIKSTGMKEEDAQKALQGDMPLYLRGKANM